MVWIARARQSEPPRSETRCIARHFARLDRAVPSYVRLSCTTRQGCAPDRRLSRSASGRAGTSTPRPHSQSRHRRVVAASQALRSGRGGWSRKDDKSHVSRPTSLSRYGLIGEPARRADREWGGAGGARGVTPRCPGRYAAVRSDSDRGREASTRASRSATSGSSASDSARWHASMHSLIRSVRASACA
jgi:hypothetical protein